MFSDDAALVASVIAIGFSGVTLALESGFSLSTDGFLFAPLFLIVVLYYEYAEEKWARYKAARNEPPEDPKQYTATDGGRDQ